MKMLPPIPIEEYRKYHVNILGVKKPIGNTVTVEDNLTNRIVLGCVPPQPIRFPMESLQLEGLKDFQKEDVFKMVNSTAFLNRNRMGSGKTIETVVACRERGFGSILVLCPKPTIGQWVAQIKAWWPERAADVVAFVATPAPTVPKNAILVTNYDKLVLSGAQDLFFGRKWDCLVADEVHWLRNRNAKRTQEACRIRAGVRYGLSGTPMLRTPEDFWSIFKFLSADYGTGSYWNFVHYYCKIVETFFGKEIQGLTEDQFKVGVLNQLLAFIGCSHNDLVVANGKERITVPLVMSSAQRKLYDNIRKLILDELPATLTIPNGAVRVLRLIQCTSAPEIIGATEAGVKFEWIKELLESYPTEKIVVFSQYEQVVQKLNAYLTKAGIKSVLYTGSIASEKDREAAKQQFIAKTSGCRAILGTIGALGTGVDGLQNASHICVFLDRYPLPTINEQCEDRLNRMGQTQGVLCYYLECEKTFDQKVATVNFNRAEDIRRALQEVSNE